MEKDLKLQANVMEGTHSSAQGTIFNFVHFIHSYNIPSAIPKPPSLRSRYSLGDLYAS